MSKINKKMKRRMHVHAKKAHRAARKAIARRHAKPMPVKIKKSAKATKVVTEKVASAREEAASQRSTKKSREAVANVYTQDEITAAVEELSRNVSAAGYLKKNVSKRALDVINKLVVPKTDEALAAELDMKINAVRRILNIMQGYGITNYYIAKNVNGWLSFAWYINISKLPPFFEYIDSIENKKPAINTECNDYFICKNCYDANKLIFTFDAAFEENFRCSGCGKSMIMMDKEQASALITETHV